MRAVRVLLPKRAAMLALAVSVLSLGLLATTAQASSFLNPVSSFGTAGSGAGQLQTPVGVAVDPSSGDVYVADSANARVEKFDASGHFIAAFGWGVADGKAQSEVCTSNCQAGIPGGNAGEFARPTSIAVHGGVIFVGDAGAEVVQELDAQGKFLAKIDGTTTPQHGYLNLVGVAVDQSGNLWTADGGTDNIDEYDAHGSFVQQWNDTYGSTLAIAVDSTNNKVYLIRGAQTTESWSLNGKNEAVVDGMGTGIGSGVALTLDPTTGNLFVDHGGDVAVYDSGSTPIDSFSLGSITNSQGLAVSPATGDGGDGHGTASVYVSDASNNDVTIFRPPSTKGAPLVTGTAFGKTSETMNATIVTVGHETTCTFQYVSDADFKATGYANATTVPCTPQPLLPRFSYREVSATATGLTPNAIYHFRVVATNELGTTTTGSDHTFQAAPGQWAPFDRCPVDDPAMLAADGVNTLPLCVANHAATGSITIGNLTTPIGDTNLQLGVVATAAGQYTAVTPPGGAVISAPVSVLNGTVTATVENAGSASNFNLAAGLSLNVPIVTLPVKIHLESQSLPLGPNCFIGSDQNPIVLNPENTGVDIANAFFTFSEFDANGNPDPTGLQVAVRIGGLIQGDNTFAVPAAQGCGTNDSLDATVNAVVGLPSPAGHNNLVLNDAESDSILTANGTTGPEFSSEWHDGFG